MNVGSSAAATVLIADDEPRIADLLYKGFRARGLAPTVVSDGLEALQMARSGVFDVLVLDIGLPSLDGLTLVSALRLESALPVVILTARTEAEDVRAGLEAGADDYVTKPFRFAELYAIVAGHLQRLSRASQPGPRERLLAVLSFDSWQALGLVGARSAQASSGDRHVVYSCEATDVVLDVRHGSDGMLHVDGQLLPLRDLDGMDVQVRVLRDGRQVASATPDELGEFTLPGVAPGTYGLRLVIGDALVEIPDLELVR